MMDQCEARGPLYKITVYAIYTRFIIYLASKLSQKLLIMLDLIARANWVNGSLHMDNLLRKILQDVSKVFFVMEL